jgi:beta-glucosidase
LNCGDASAPPPERVKPEDAAMTTIHPYQDLTVPLEQRVDDLLGRLTLDEKIAQLVNNTPPVDRLGIPKYDWWNECLHGVARAGEATVFPQAIGLAAMFDSELLERVAIAIGDEVRAKHHEAARNGVRTIYTGLSCWSPNINIFRDPRWGRGQETYGEDPYLTARLGVTFIRALQGDDPHYLKVAACAKHYAVHSGPEQDRHHFNAEASPGDLWDTYLPAFEAAVKEGGVETVMSAYNRTNSEACSASPTLLQDILRDRWGFTGHVVSDCGAIDDLYKHHRVAADAAEASAQALLAGCDLCCGDTYLALGDAVTRGLVTEAQIDVALRRLLRTRFKLGMFDPDDAVAYAQIPFEVVGCDAHHALALEATRASLVLLKNENGLLPLRRESLRTLAVIGPNADDVRVLLGNYHGEPINPYTPLRGLRERLEPGVDVLYAEGCPLTGDPAAADFSAALDVANRADAVVLVMGLSQALEGEEGHKPGVGDRSGLGLPEVQEALVKAVTAAGKPTVLVLFNGSPVAVNWAQAHVPAIIEAWYPGQAAGIALAEVLLGDYNPAGRLPITFPKSFDQIPAFEDYDMRGRTYRYMDAEPLYPFGYGLSYTTFAYHGLTLAQAGDAVAVTVKVTNSGDRAGDEVVQLYLRDVEASVPVAKHRLAGFTRVYLAAGETRQVAFTLKPEQFALVLPDGTRAVEPGMFRIAVGGGQPGFAANVISADWIVSTARTIG